MSNTRKALSFYAITLTLAILVRLTVPWIGEASLPLTMLTPTLGVLAMLLVFAPEGGWRHGLSSLGLTTAGCKAWPFAIQGQSRLSTLLMTLAGAGDDLNTSVRDHPRRRPCKFHPRARNGSYRRSSRHLRTAFATNSCAFTVACTRARACPAIARPLLFIARCRRCLELFRRLVTAGRDVVGGDTRGCPAGVPGLSVARAAAAVRASPGGGPGDRVSSSARRLIAAIPP